jgi:hypothetical protein
LQAAAGAAAGAATGGTTLPLDVRAEPASVVAAPDVPNVSLTLEVNGSRHDQSDQITTVEGLAQPDGSLHPLQQAFLAQDAFQCGYCTPGQLCSAVGLIEEHRRLGGALTDAAIAESMSGNLCRCGAYPHILVAIRQVAAGETGSGGGAAGDGGGGADSDTP